MKHIHVSFGIHNPRFRKWQIWKCNLKKPHANFSLICQLPRLIWNCHLCTNLFNYVTVRCNYFRNIHINLQDECFIFVLILEVNVSVLEVYKSAVSKRQGSKTSKLKLQTSETNMQLSKTTMALHCCKKRYPIK